MNENKIRFKLACNSPLFHKNNLIKLGSYSQNKEAQTLLWEDQEILFDSEEVT